MSAPAAEALRVEQLGSALHPSPLDPGALRARRSFDAVLVSALLSALPHTAEGPPPAFELAGPRPRLFVDPERATIGIVTCGGLCPGLNDVIRSVAVTAILRYRVRRLLGFRYGFAGVADDAIEPLTLDPDVVDDIHRHGGTLLGSSRGPQDVTSMVSRLAALEVDALICVGGDGTLRGAAALALEVRRQGRSIAVIAVPKTIDNDLPWVERSFGFSTGVEEAGRAIAAAHAEARGARHGVGLVKLMGRHSGFIAAHASLAFPDVNLCLVPEVPFDIPLLLEAVVSRLEARHHAVIVVAEGAGQEHLTKGGSPGTDASGNDGLLDVGPWLRDELVEGLRREHLDPTVKYLDPSYAIRSRPANATDAEFCGALGMHAVHAALSGHTNLMIGYWNQQFTHVPLGVAVRGHRRLDPEGEVWQRVLHATGQPDLSAATPGPAGPRTVSRPALQRLDR